MPRKPLISPDGTEHPDEVARKRNFFAPATTESTLTAVVAVNAAPWSSDIDGSGWFSAPAGELDGPARHDA